jgi:glutamate 5-kinase
VKTIVVKVGSSTVADDQLRLRRRLLAGLVADIAELSHGGGRLVLVSSGAIACGQHVLGVSERPHQVPALQAASAVGQGRLFAHYERLFGDHELTAAQVLLTSEDFARRSSYVNARNTLRRLLSWGVVPVVNENDTTATDEIRFGDNDVLAAQVAIMLRADYLVLLTDQDGLYTMDPRRHGAAELVRTVTDPAQLTALDVGDASHRGAGGMRGKTLARTSARRSSPVPRAPLPSSSGCATQSRCVVPLKWTPGRREPWRRGEAAFSRSASKRCTARSRPVTPSPSSGPPPRRSRGV